MSEMTDLAPAAASYVCASGYVTCVCGAVQHGLHVGEGWMLVRCNATIGSVRSGRGDGRGWSRRHCHQWLLINSTGRGRCVVAPITDEEYKARRAQRPQQIRRLRQGIQPAQPDIVPASDLAPVPLAVAS